MRHAMLEPCLPPTSDDGMNRDVFALAEMADIEEATDIAISRDSFGTLSDCGRPRTTSGAPEAPTRCGTDYGGRNKRLDARERSPSSRWSGQTYWRVDRHERIEHRNRRNEPRIPENHFLADLGIA